MKYRITGHIEDDDKQIAELFSESFGGRQFDLNAWHRNNRSNPVQSYCVASMWEGDRLIAHTELTPVKAMIDGQATICGVSGTTMARRGYPGASVAVYRWIDQAYPEYCKLGFPNEQSFPLIEKVLKHKYIGDVDFWWKRISSSHATDEKTFGDYSFIETKTPSLSLDFLSVYDGCRYSLMRDRDFVQWRFIDRVEKGYHYFECEKQGKIVGYVVLNKYYDVAGNSCHGQIIDFFAVDTYTFEALVQFAENWFRNEDIEMVKLWCTLPQLQESLIQIGYQYGLRPFHVELWHHKMLLQEMNLSLADSDVF